ncbi:MAG TPA: tetraacyldisaccharide 4'-kinase [Methylomirabilota bacterium]|nr:tetraacyldisaccharide 4'-kinase [Methylomirabilota bacterium]
MRAPGFWWRPGSAASLLLAPVGAAVGRIAARRMARPSGLPPPIPVLCVGNFVAGGAGKTPTAIALARIVTAAGMKPAFLTRGYGGRLKGPVIVDPSEHGVVDVGDEALLLARAAPTVVARKRPWAFPLLQDTGADIVIMDDGFQNPSVVKMLSLVVVDAAVGIGAGRVIPAGPLRAPLAEQLPRADAVLVIGEGEGGRDMVRRAARAGKPVLHARIVSNGLTSLAGTRVYAFAGIGRPQKFFDSLVDEGLDVVGTREFADHHTFTGLDAREILTAAAALDATILTTEKDAVRLAGSSGGPQAELTEKTIVVPIACVFEDEARVRQMIVEARKAWIARR